VRRWRLLLRTGVRGILTHRLRSALSVLGIGFGVAAVIAVGSVLEGARREALVLLGALGDDTFSIRAGADASDVLPLNAADADALRAIVPGATAAAPLRAVQLDATGGRGVSSNVDVLGTTSAYGRVASVPVAEGRFISEIDVRQRRRVAVLGRSVADRLFPVEGARGGGVRIDSDWYQVVGVLRDHASGDPRSSRLRSYDLNRSILIPLTAFDYELRSAGEVDEIVVRIEATSALIPAAEAAQRIIARRVGDVPFQVVVPREVLRQQQRTRRMFGWVTGAVAAICLLVGGTGIMNMMLASVAERQTEIGVRRAVGATRGHITAQFLAEAMLLGSLGAVPGVILGVLGSLLIQQAAGWTTSLSLWSLLLSPLFAVAVAVVFAWHPARRASRLTPLAALRRA